MNKLKLSRFNDVAYLVTSEQDEHVGNLKLINGAWKFKAIGYDADGDVIPGGGPFTHRHNTLFATPDANEVNTRFDLS